MTATPVSIDDARRRKRDDGGARVPPNNVAAEESLLGAMLLRPDAIEAALEARLGPEDFYKPAHGHVFSAIAALYAGGDPADPVTVAEALTRAGVLEAIGGPAVLVSLQAGTPSIGNAGRYARIVAEHSLLRRLIRVGGDIEALGYDLPDDVPAAVDAAEQLVYGLRPSSEDLAACPLVDVLGEWIDVLEQRVATGGAVERPMGWRDLDYRYLGGLHPGRLVVVAARPGMGKTSWSGALTTNVAGRGDPVLFFSIEMGREELAGRMVASATGLIGSTMSRGELGPRDWERISVGVGTLGALPIDIVDTTPVTLLSVRAGIRRAARRYGRLGLVVIDYVQLMTGRHAENRQVEVAEVVRGLKLLSKEMAVPVVALAQLSRNLEQRSDKRPGLADLRETGELENSADQVVFIYRDELYNPNTEDKGIAELIVGKNRHGPTGTVKVGADLATGRWSDLSRREEML